MGGTKYMRQMLDMYGGNVPLALAAYNAGPYNKSVMRGVIPRNGETPEYVRRVTAFERQFRAMPNDKLNTFNTKANEQAKSVAGGAPVVINNISQANVSGGTTQSAPQSGNGGCSQPDTRGLSSMVACQ
jgi:hypothetical protein